MDESASTSKPQPAVGALLGSAPLRSAIIFVTLAAALSLGVMGGMTYGIVSRSIPPVR